MNNQYERLNYNLSGEAIVLVFDSESPTPFVIKEVKRSCDASSFSYEIHTKFVTSFSDFNEALGTFCRIAGMRETVLAGAPLI